MKTIFYRPLTATPWKQNRNYRELPPQNPQLARDIRCFWGSEAPYRSEAAGAGASLVIPDTCADLIYRADHTEGTVTGGFCGVSDASFQSGDPAKPGHLVSVFAIRFFAWNASAFSEDSLKNTRNSYNSPETHFRWADTLLRQLLLEKVTLKERAQAAEALFLPRLPSARRNTVIEQAVNQILFHKGSLQAKDLSRECFISGRQLERLFQEYVGITPKKLCNLVRYQFLWREILQNPAFHVLDAVCQYGYTDQSHLLREFKRYHAMDIQTAKTYACRNVGNIQDIS